MTPLTAAQRAMVADNLGLCGWAVNRWFRHLPPGGAKGYTRDDAYQDAVLGLARAVQLFDPDHGTKFSTYAANWIRQAVHRGLGDHEGINHRRVHYQSDRATDADRAMVARPVDSLDRPLTEDGGTLLDLVAATGVPDSDDLFVADCRRAVCRDDLDRAIFDATIIGDEYLAPVARRCGVAPSKVNYRRRAMIARLRARELVLA